MLGVVLVVVMTVVITDYHVRGRGPLVMSDSFMLWCKLRCGRQTGEQMR